MGESTEVTLAVFPELPPSSGSGGFRGGPPTACVFQSMGLSMSDDMLSLPSVNSDLIRGDLGTGTHFSYLLCILQVQHIEDIWEMFA